MRAPSLHLPHVVGPRGAAPTHRIRGHVWPVVRFVLAVLVVLALLLALGVLLYGEAPMEPLPMPEPGVQTTAP
jgi:hypothetical protein